MMWIIILMIGFIIGFLVHHKTQFAHDILNSIGFTAVESH